MYLDFILKLGIIESLNQDLFKDTIDIIILLSTYIKKETVDHYGGGVYYFVVKY